MAFNDGDKENPIVGGSYVKAICGECGSEHLLFDSHVHGWDGFVCHLEEIRELTDLLEISCDNCNAQVFRVEMIVSSQGQEDFIYNLKEEIDAGQFTPEEWVNAFDWITISLVCAKCGKSYPEFVEYETM
jgi:DNA-directed RNA polymerase subunit RPC12/RpoP